MLGKQYKTEQKAKRLVDCRICDEDFQRFELSPLNLFHSLTKGHSSKRWKSSSQIRQSNKLLNLNMSVLTK